MLTVYICRSFKDSIFINFMAIHPAYFRRGHGLTMAKWCVALADMDGISIGASSVPAARTLVATLGFQEREVVEVPGYKDHPEGISFSIGKRDPVPLADR